jgi:hypothetical protein
MLGGATPDAAVGDGFVATTDTAPCYGSGLVRVCFASAPPGMVEISTSAVFDTDSDPLCQVIDGRCVVSGDQLLLAQGVTVAITGSRPLVAVATSSLTVDGTIDAASHRVGGRSGPGTSVAACPIAPSAAAATGGPGGSFGGRGGRGGDSGANSGTNSSPTTAPTLLHAGCRGSPGGAGGGAGGLGGGVIYLIAGGTITISGIIDASGASGAGGSPQSGGGGGGSGGMIGIDAPLVTVGGGAQIFANGGGGGEGGDTASGAGGGEATSPTVPATGGTGGTQQAGDGGNGSYGITLAGAIGGSSAVGSAGGGGGGGGAGYVLVFPRQPLGGSIAPPPP